MTLLLLLACAADPMPLEDATCSEVRACKDLEHDEASTNDRHYQLCAACDAELDQCTTYVLDEEGAVADSCVGVRPFNCAVLYYDYCDWSS